MAPRWPGSGRCGSDGRGARVGCCSGEDALGAWGRRHDQRLRYDRCTMIQLGRSSAAVGRWGADGGAWPVLPWELLRSGLALAGLAAGGGGGDLQALGTGVVHEVC